MKPISTGFWGFLSSSRVATGGGRRWRRGGVSLLEVLISIFVLSIGLLAVAAIIPVGRLAIVEAAKSDRAAACGQAVINDVKVRRMINLGDLRNYSNGGLAREHPREFTDPDPLLHAKESGFRLGESYAIDNLYLTRPEGENERGRLQHFPYNIRNLGSAILPR